jgi:PPK2 family polyphosphate:nucleotide phosphotransferase
LRAQLATLAAVDVNYDSVNHSMKSQPLTVSPGTKVALADFDPHCADGDWDKDSAGAQVEKNSATIAGLAYRLYAEDQRALLVVLQGVDAAGKDGTIRVVMSSVNPQSCQVTSFKQPSEEELDHDFLWRIHKAVPRRGNIGIFNRSHYEDVLVVRVHKLAPEAEWKSRYSRINEFEELLVEGGMTILKFFLHISKDEQRQRLQERLDDHGKRWKFRLGDLDERKLWDDYQQAYEDALTKCNTKHAPWHIVPADRKWYRNLIVSQTIRQTLEKMDPQFPPPEPGLEGIQIE